MTDRYLTSPIDVLPPTRVALGSALISSEPLRSRLGGYARFGWRTAREVASSLGGDLPTRAEVIALYEQAKSAGLHLKPVTLPDLAMLKSHFGQGWTVKGQDQIDVFRNANMQSEAWCEYHDATVDEQLEALGWHDQGGAVLVGKLWIHPFEPDGHGEVPGSAYLMGWPDEHGHWIQSGLYSPGVRPFHVDTYADYSSMTMVIWR